MVSINFLIFMELLNLRGHYSQKILKTFAIFERKIFKKIHMNLVLLPVFPPTPIPILLSLWLRDELLLI